jgi:nucleotide sugar dehydrogenase
VVIESPLEPGMCEQICLPILEKESNLSRYEFHFAHCPLREPSIDGAWHILNTPRVIGAQSEEALARAGTLYRSLLDAEIVLLPSIKEVEVVHLLESAFENVNAALVSELAMAIRDNHLDITRIVRGAATKPFGFLATFPGFVAARLSADPLHTLHRGMRTSSEHRLFAAAHKVNHGMPGFIAHLLADALREKRINIKKTVVALLGLDAPLESGPIATLADALKKKGVSVRAYDPRVPLESAMRSLETTLPGVKAAIIARADPEFCALTPAVFAEHNIPIVIDACNCLDKSAFLTAGVLYRGIGR